MVLESNDTGTHWWLRCVSCQTRFHEAKRAGRPSEYCPACKPKYRRPHSLRASEERKKKSKEPRVRTCKRCGVEFLQERIGRPRTYCLLHSARD